MKDMRVIKAVTNTGAETDGPPLALLGRGPGDGYGEKAVHAGPGVIAQSPGQTAVDDDLHPFDGQAGFGDIGGQDHFTLFGRKDGFFLLLKRQIPVNGDVVHSIQ